MQPFFISPLPSPQYNHCCGTTALGTTSLSELQKIQHLKANPDLVPPHTPAHLGTGNTCSAVTHSPRGVTTAQGDSHPPSLAALWLAQVTHRAQGGAAHATGLKAQQCLGMALLPMPGTAEKLDGPRSHCQSQSSPNATLRQHWHSRAVPGTAGRAARSNTQDVEVAAWKEN